MERLRVKDVKKIARAGVTKGTRAVVIGAVAYAGANGVNPPKVEADDCVTGFVASLPPGESLVVVEEDAVTGQVVGEATVTDQQKVRFTATSNAEIGGQRAFRARVFNRAVPAVKKEFTAVCGTGPVVDFINRPAAVVVPGVQTEPGVTTIISNSVNVGAVPVGRVVETAPPTSTVGVVGVPNSEPIHVTLSDEARRTILWGLLGAGTLVAAGLLLSRAPWRSGDGRDVIIRETGVPPAPGEETPQGRERWRQRLAGFWPGRSREVEEARREAEEARSAAYLTRDELARTQRELEILRQQAPEVRNQELQAKVTALETENQRISEENQNLNIRAGNAEAQVRNQAETLRLVRADNERLQREAAGGAGVVGLERQLTELETSNREAVDLLRQGNEKIRGQKERIVSLEGALEVERGQREESEGKLQTALEEMERQKQHITSLRAGLDEEKFNREEAEGRLQVVLQESAALRQEKQEVSEAEERLRRAQERSLEEAQKKAESAGENVRSLQEIMDEMRRTLEES